MRVLFLTLYPDVVASPRYRVTQFLPYLRSRGIECVVAPALTAELYACLMSPDRRARPVWYHLAETPRRLRQILAGHRCDAIFVQKALTSAYLRGILALTRVCARRIVYDFDDAVHLAPPHPLRSVWRLAEDRTQIRKLLSAASLVLAGNGWLLSAARKEGAQAVLFPTVVDTDRFVPPAAPPATFRVGWIGTPAATPCLEPAAEALASLESAEVCLVGADPRHVPCPNVVVQPWSLETEVDALQQFSVGIMPMPKIEWMQGKCALKALLYMACGVPCVATPYGAALELIQHEQNGLFADSTVEWREALERLRDPMLRARLGQAARATVEDQYSLRRAAPRLLELLESVP